MRWSVGVLTAPRPRSRLAETVRSLAQAGWSDLTLRAEPGTPVAQDRRGVRVVVNDRRLGPHLNFRTTLHGLLTEQPAADAYAVFEDDILVTKNLRSWLESRGLWPSDRVGVLSLFTAAVNDRPEDGWHPCVGLPGRAYGAQAFVFPPDCARAYLAMPQPRSTWGQQDYWVGWWCLKSGLEYWMHSPSFVRHIGDASSIIDQPLNEYRQCRRFVEEISVPE